MTMLLSRNEVDNLTLESLNKFLSLRMPEGAQIDYKENLSGDNKKESYKEFLKDVTAFANAHGGLLLLGVKEPSYDCLPEDQIVGIVEGDNIAKNLERVAATSIDPRIPGLLIKPVPVNNNKYVIAVFIPPSMIRPHMLCHHKYRSFYIRHSESSVPMSTHEIRDTVLSSAISESVARSYAIQEEIEALEYIIKDIPAFLMQAMPILKIEQTWDVLDKTIVNVFRNEERRDKYNHRHFNLVSNIDPIPNIKGAIGSNSRVNEEWFTEVHRNGYIHAVYMNIQESPRDSSKLALHKGYTDLFLAFRDFCEEIWKVTQTDIPYLFRCNYFNAENTIFIAPSTIGYESKQYNKRNIVWAEQIRQVGESLDSIYRAWSEQLFNAFGLNWKMPK